MQFNAIDYKYYIFYNFVKTVITNITNIFKRPMGTIVYTKAIKNTERTLSPTKNSWLRFV
jgi:hypothetical protein